MSSRKPLPLKLSPIARDDFIGILRSTGETWGHDQLVTYRDKLDGALQAIARNPALGHRRDDLPATHQAYLVGSHVIVYRIEADRIGVVRILHQRMSLPRHVWRDCLTRRAAAPALCATPMLRATAWRSSRPIIRPRPC